MKTYNLEFKWTVSRGRDTYGYNICTLYVNGNRAARCNGGGYDMEGTVLGNWIAATFPDDLRKLTTEFYGLTFHDPNFDPGKAVVKGETVFDGPADGKTVEQLEKEGKSFGLDRYQAFYSASSKLPTERHTVPLLDGGCGFSCMTKVGKAIGMTFERIPTRRRSDNSFYRVEKE